MAIMSGHFTYPRAGASRERHAGLGLQTGPAVLRAIRPGPVFRCDRAVTLVWSADC
jgi:hypothetical protein